MNVLPVITRELRAQARQRFTFTLRIAGVGAMLAAASLFAVQYSAGPDLGAVLFRYLHLTLFGAIWILVPLSAADCISRERREGTLGLLFLTPLKAADIVMAKSISHGLRAGTLLVAILPVLTIPFLLGGLSWQQASLSALTNFSAVCWALAAAVVASAGTRSGLRASVGAIVFALCGLLAFAYLTGLFVSVGGLLSGRNYAGGADYTLLLGFWLTGISAGRGFSPLGLGTPSQLLTGFLESAFFSLVALLGAIVFAAWQIRRTWREEPPPIWVQQVQAFFCTPVLWLKFFKRWMRWKIERNPIGWLEQRTWTGRLVTWAWFAIVISIYSAAFTDRNFFRNFGGLQTTLAWLMMGSVAASAAGSFRRERESGVLELLLVAPLSARQIIGGRLRGLWGQFLPAVTALLGIWLYFQSIFPSLTDTPKILFFAAAFVALPVTGLYFSLRCRSFIAAFVFTLAAGFFVPLLLPRALGLVWWWYAKSNLPFDADFGPGVAAALVQLLCVGPFLFGMQRRLERRLFPLERIGQ